MNRICKILLLPLLALDCLGNAAFCDGSFRNTMSGEAWNHRDHPEWNWCYRAVDWAFGPGHCQRAAEKEALHGSVWASWWAEVKRGT